MTDSVTTEIMQPSVTVPDEKPKRRSLFTNRNFQLLWFGEGVSLLGDQFYMIALPWLALELTHSEAALGMILMVAGIPRAVFMLVGGVFTDRFAPRTLMIISNTARSVITVSLIALVVTQTLQVWMLFVISFAFGLTDAFFHPAYMAITPMIIDEEHLQAGNTVTMSTSLIINAIGPGLAGLLVNSVGASLSFIIDAISFAIAALSELLMQTPKTQIDAHKELNMGREIGEMFHYVNQDKLLRNILLLATALNFFFGGALTVGPAALAKTRFPEGAVAFGAILSAMSIGSLLGMAAGGMLHPKRFGLASVSLIAIGGAAMAILGITQTLFPAVFVTLITGFSVGFANIMVITWLQKRIAKEMMGRVMSLIGLASVGLTPISAALSGIVAEYNLTLLFIVCGASLVIVCALALMDKEIRTAQL